MALDPGDIAARLVLREIRALDGDQRAALMHIYLESEPQGDIDLDMRDRELAERILHLLLGEKDNPRLNGRALALRYQQVRKEQHAFLQSVLTKRRRREEEHALLLNPGDLPECKRDEAMYFEPNTVLNLDDDESAGYSYSASVHPAVFERFLDIVEHMGGIHLLQIDTQFTVGDGQRRAFARIMGSHYHDDETLVLVNAAVANGLGMRYTEPNLRLMSCSRVPVLGRASFHVYATAEEVDVDALRGALEKELSARPAISRGMRVELPGFPVVRVQELRTPADEFVQTASAPPGSHVVPIDRFTYEKKDQADLESRIERAERQSKCGRCGHSDPPLRCGNCLQGYCSRICQAADWNRHKGDKCAQNALSLPMQYAELRAFIEANGGRKRGREEGEENVRPQKQAHARTLSPRVLHFLQEQARNPRIVGRFLAAHTPAELLQYVGIDVRFGFFLLQSPLVEAVMYARYAPNTARLFFDTLRRWLGVEGGGDED